MVCSKLQINAFGSCCVVFDCHNYESLSAIDNLYKDGTLSQHTASVVDQDTKFINCGIDLLRLSCGKEYSRLTANVPFAESCNQD